MSQVHLIDHPLVQHKLSMMRRQESSQKQFRAALRDAIEQVKDVAGAHGIFNMSPQDHLGLDQRGVVMVKIENGKWVYQPGK